jgi:hypothetical protein
MSLFPEMDHPEQAARLVPKLGVPVRKAYEVGHEPVIGDMDRSSLPAKERQLNAER